MPKWDGSHRRCYREDQCLIAWWPFCWERQSCFLLTGKAKIVVVQTKVAISFSNFEATCRSHQTDLIVVVLCFLFFHGVHTGMLQGSAPFDLREAIEVLLWWMSLPFCISSNMCQVLLAVGLERSADLRQLLASELEVAHQVQFFFTDFSMWISWILWIPYASRMKLPVPQGQADHAGKLLHRIGSAPNRLAPSCPLQGVLLLSAFRAADQRIQLQAAQGVAWRHR